MLRCDTDILIRGRGQDGGSGTHSEDLPPPSREVRQIRGTLAEWLRPSPLIPPQQPTDLVEAQSPLIPLNSPQAWSRHNPHASPSTAHRHGRGIIPTHPPQQPTDMDEAQSPLIPLNSPQAWGGHNRRPDYDLKARGGHTLTFFMQKGQNTDLY